MPRYLYWLILAFTFIGPSPALAQTEPAEAVNVEQTTPSPAQLTTNLLQQLYLATIACAIDTDYPDRKCWVTKEHNEQTVLRTLYTYGLRLSPEIGITVMAVETDKPNESSLVAVAAHNSIGAPVYVYVNQNVYSLVSVFAHSSVGAPLLSGGVTPLSVDAQADGQGVFRAGRQQVPLNGTLNTYNFNMGPTGIAEISAPRQGLTYDIKTGLVTATAP